MEATSLRPFTSRTTVALAIARGLAAARGDTDLTAAHVVVGILRERRNAAVHGLWYAGLSERAIDGLSSEFEQALPAKRSPRDPHAVTIDLTPGETRILNDAEVEANEFGDPYLGTEHILLALLRSDALVARRFAERGISLKQYYNGLLSSRRGDPPPQMPHHV